MTTNAQSVAIIMKHNEPSKNKKIMDHLNSIRNQQCTKSIKYNIKIKKNEADRAGSTIEFFSFPGTHIRFK